MGDIRIKMFLFLLLYSYLNNACRLFWAFKVITILSFDEVTDFMIHISQDLLRRFVREFQNMYGIQFCFINVHLLLHLGDDVKKLGPLWAYTCYKYENLNGQL